MKKQNEDFAIIHNTPKGQLLITKELGDDEYIITLWINIEIGTAKLALKIEDEELANKAFDAYRDYELAKTAINTALNQEYL
jgi:hypothetical protein|nr:MAG TPA: hypothetical protein [Caudoviricetes sp.]